MQTLTLTSIAAGLTLTFLVFELLRRGFLREKYAFVWLAFDTFIAISLIFPSPLQELSAFLGFKVFSNFILANLVLALILFAMQLSLEISKLEDNNQKLAEEIAIINNKLNQ